MSSAGWSAVSWPGAGEIERSVTSLKARLPQRLAPLAALAFNFWWTWQPGGAELFRAVDPHRWERVRENPVRLLQEASGGTLRNAASDRQLAERAAALADRLDHELTAPPLGGVLTPQAPLVFLSAEFAVHRSLPIYAGGLGVLAGDVLKQCSDSRLAAVGVGLLYRQGYLRQRIDASGWQHECWSDADLERLPAALVAGPDGGPLKVRVPLRDREVVVQVWRGDVGRVPLYLLDSDQPENTHVDRWITARLYVGSREVRLDQYTLLGLGAIRALRAMGIEPGVVHVNEGHAALAPVELAREAAASGVDFEGALALARRRTVFTTHTPVRAGNESFAAADALGALGGLARSMGVAPSRLLDLGRSSSGGEEPFGLTTLAIRMSRAVNGVSRQHAATARSMWSHLFPGTPVEAVPIPHVTNGVHVPTWTAAPMRDLLDRYLGTEWTRHAQSPATWAGVDAIPDQELWMVRVRLRAALVDYVREHSVADRLARGEPRDRVIGAARSFRPDILTVGFARRIASYKRLHVLVHDPARALALLDGAWPLQILLAGVAHPEDEPAKQMVQRIFRLKNAPLVSERVVYLEDYDLGMAAHLVAGCDVWINLPRPPLEASGTSGMKAVLNGGLNLSILDGWWAEAFDGANGWAIESPPDGDEEAQDAHDAAALYDLLEREVVPAFYERGADGVPHAWVRRVKHSLRTLGPRFGAGRMVDEYVSAVWNAESSRTRTV